MILFSGSPIMHPIQQTIPGALREVLRKAPLSTGKVAFAWRVAVGPGVERATSVRLHEGVLHVDAADKTWASEVRRASEMILTRLGGLLGPGTVRTIEVHSQRQ